MVDANVLIDYLAADATILRQVSRHIGPLYVPRQVLREVPRLGPEDHDRLALRNVEETVEQLLEAGQQQGRLSFHDRLCLILARDNGWTCVTNDKALRRACEALSVPVLWGLELMIQLVAGGHLAAEAALETAAVIRKSNPQHITEDILERLKSRLASL